MSLSKQPTFSLKDHLFNLTKVEKIAGEITAVYPLFDTVGFIKRVVAAFPDQELLARLLWITACLREYLPNDYQAAVTILLKSLPPPLDPTLTDNDYGDFIYGPYGAFVAEYGCTEELVEFSLAALREFTTRFSVEFPIRSFLNQFPEQTLQVLSQWVADPHYHVRRLVSEGTRPNLPWAKKITIDYRDPLPLLDCLYADPTRYVTRSVANHLNDIAKRDPQLVIEALQRWKKAGKQTPLELAFITRHALRSLIKSGDRAALQLLGYQKPLIEVSIVQIHTKTVAVGSALQFSFALCSTALVDQPIMVNYVLYFQKANGSLAPKTFKISQTTIRSHQTLQFEKQHPLRLMTTRKLYLGAHRLELQINGAVYAAGEFALVA